MSIRVVDPTCSECGEPLTDATSRALLIGPKCRRGMTPEQLRAAAARAAARNDPFRIPAERAPSRAALVNNRNAKAAAAGGVQVCERHGGQLGRCPQCTWEAQPENASKLILREVRSWTFAQRRAERLRVLAARYAHVTPWRPPERPRKPPERPQRPQKRPSRPTSRPTRPTRPTDQMELL